MIELRQKARFVDEAAQADLEDFAIARGGGRYAHAGTAARERGRQILLERDFALEDTIVREIHDAEAALADEADNLELVQARAHGERVGAQRCTGRRRLIG